MGFHNGYSNMSYIYSVYDNAQKFTNTSVFLVDTLICEETMSFSGFDLYLLMINDPFPIPMSHLSSLGKCLM